MNGKRLLVSASPHIHAPETTRGIMLDVILALLPALAAAIWLFGSRAAVLTAVCVGTAVLAAAVAGGLAGFLLFNFSPAKVWMGDTGSLFLGAIVCGLAFAIDLPLILIPAGIIYIIENIGFLSILGNLC